MSSTQAEVSTNFIVRLTGDGLGGPLAGVGECQPRERATGDRENLSWDFLRAAIADVEGFVVESSNPAKATESVAEKVDELRGSAACVGANRSSFRGTLLGVETALLDFAARAHGLGLFELLGARRSSFRIAEGGTTLTNELMATEERGTPRSREASTARFELGADPVKSIETFVRLARQHPDDSAVWWLDARAALTFSQAESFVKDIAKAMRRGRAPQSLIVEQPVGASKLDEMAALQALADRLVRKSRHRSPDLRIMADESLSSAADLAQLMADEGCRAINVKAGRLGGILPSLHVVADALRHNPDTVVALSSMAGTSGISFRAMQHLALALPRLDYFTRQPPGRTADIALFDVDYSSRTRELQAPGTPGLGLNLDYEAIADAAGRYTVGPSTKPPTAHGQTANAYPDEHPTRLLTKTAMRSHLVEREALSHGLSVVRFSPTSFLARAPSGSILPFGASARSPASGACSFMISDQNKGAAQALLARAGLPVPEGRVFARSDIEGAKKFANTIGYPVVTKPVSGTGGAGVSTNIQNDDELAEGFEAVRSTRFANDDILLQRHVAGEVYRIIVSAGEVTAALLRVPPSVTGDGNRTVAELMLERNAYRTQNPRLRKGLIDSQSAAAHLKSHGRNLSEVPRAGEQVFLSSQAYLNRGGESLDVLHELHGSIAEIAVRAVAAIPELRFCGVDILLENHCLDAHEQAVGICELNACPELITPQYPLFGKPKYVARQLLSLAAHQRGVSLPEQPATHLSCKLAVSGRLGDGYLRWLSRRADELGLRGWGAHASSGVEAVISGATVPVCTLTSLAITGPPDARPASVTVSHAEAVESDGFELRRAFS